MRGSPPYCLCAPLQSVLYIDIAQTCVCLGEFSGFVFLLKRSKAGWLVMFSFARNDMEKKIGNVHALHIMKNMQYA